MIPTIQVPSGRQESATVRTTNGATQAQQDTTTKFEQRQFGSLDKMMPFKDSFATQQIQRQHHGYMAPATASLVPTVGPRVKLIEKSVIILRDENGFGLRIRGQAPVCVEHVHVGSAAWRAGVRRNDIIGRVNGVPTCELDHKSVVLMLKSCARFVALTLLCPVGDGEPATALVVGGPDTVPRRGSLAANEGRIKYWSNESGPNVALDENNVDNNNNRSLSKSSCNKQPATTTGVCIFCRARLLDDGTTLCVQCQLNNTTKTGKSQATAPAVLKTQRLHHQPLQHAGSLREQQATRNTSMANTSINHQRLATFSSGSLLSARTDQPIVTVAPTNTSGQKQQPPSGGSQTANKPKVNKRLEIIRELLDTERAHTERLRCLDELFYKPLKNDKLLTSEQLKAVFPCHRKLYKLHRQIYQILLSATTAPNASTTSPVCSASGLASSSSLLLSPSSSIGANNGDQDSTADMLMCSRSNLFAGQPGSPLIGSALVEIFEGDIKRELEKAACSFCSAQATNVELLNKLTRRDTKVGEFLAQVTGQRIVLGRLGIKDLLASCFQRLTKYPLLLENLLHATPSEAPPEPLVNDDDQSLLASLERDLCGAADDYGCSASNELLPGAGSAPGRNQQRQVAAGEAADDDDDGGDSDARQSQQQQQWRRNLRRMLAISLAEERDLIGRALRESRQILVKVNESIKVALARQKFKEIWRKTDKGPNLPSIDTTKQQLIHEGALTLRLSKRAFDVHMLLLNDYIIILTRDGREDKFRLRYFTPEGKTLSSAAALAASIQPSGSSVMSVLNGPIQAQNNNNTNNNNNNQSGASVGLGNNSTQGASATAGCVPGQNIMANAGSLATISSSTGNQVYYSPIFHIDEHLTTRDAATDENGFYLLCKRRDDSRIYEFASRSPAERIKWRDLIQWTIERQIDRSRRRASCESTLTRSSITSADSAATNTMMENDQRRQACSGNGSFRRRKAPTGSSTAAATLDSQQQFDNGARQNTMHHQQRHMTSLSGEHCATPEGASRQQHPGANGNRVKNGLPSSATHSSNSSRPSTPTASEPTKIVGTISYVIDDEIVLPSKMESSRVFVDQAIQVNILDGTLSSRTPSTVMAPPTSTK